jgi:hypothetical protein
MPCKSSANVNLCVGNEPIEIDHGGKTYLFEWSAVGWLPCNRDGSERLTAIPKAVWDRLNDVPSGE